MARRGEANVHGRSAARTATAPRLAQPPTPRLAPPLAGARVFLIAVATALAAAGGTWIALQPAVTHSDLDGTLSGSLLRLYLYLPPTLVGVWLAARLLDRAERPGPVITALTLAAAGVAAGTLAEVLARFSLGHGDVLAIDGVLQRIIELVRVDVPICAGAAVLLSRRRPGDPPIPIGG
jgi:hypothetical protein